MTVSVLDRHFSFRHSRKTGNPDLSLWEQGTATYRTWIPRIKCGAGPAGVYPDKKSGQE
jgi:hypothetical protein